MAALDRAPLLEWIAAAIGLVLTIGAIAFLTWDSLQPANGPPALQVSAAAPVRTTAGYYVAVTLKNAGRSTASALEVQGELRAGETVIERGALSFDFVPEGSERTGGLYFRHDPLQAQLAVVAKGQVDP